MQFETLLLNRIVFGSTSSICEAIIATCLVYMVAKTNNVTGRRMTNQTEFIDYVPVWRVSLWRASV